MKGTESTEIGKRKEKVNSPEAIIRENDKLSSQVWNSQGINMLSPLVQDLRLVGSAKTRDTTARCKHAVIPSLSYLGSAFAFPHNCAPLALGQPSGS